MSLSKISKVSIEALLNAWVYGKYPIPIRKFKKKVGSMPNVAFPESYAERLMWRKVFDRNPLFSVFCDKLAAKEYTRGVLSNVAISKTLWTGVDIHSMPPRLADEAFVLKASHGCNFNYFHDGHRENFDRDKIWKLTQTWLGRTYGRSSLQWGYRHAQKILFAEEFIRPREKYGLLDISIRASNGVPILGSATINIKTEKSRIGYFALDGERAKVFELGRSPDAVLPDDFVLPQGFSLAVELTRALSRNIDFARYDYIWDGEKLYAGEITVYPAAGFSKPNKELDSIILRNWNMSCSWFLNKSHQGIMKIYAGQAREHFGLSAQC